MRIPSEGSALAMLALPLLPLLGAGTLLFLRGKRSVLPIIALAALLLTLASAVWTALSLPVSGWAWGPILGGRLAVAGLGRMMVILVPAIAAPVVLYASSSNRRDSGFARLLALLLAFVGAMELLVIADDFLALLIGWELVGACSWALIGYEWTDSARPRAALDAFLTTRAGDLGLYIAAAAAFAGTGSFRFDTLPQLHGTTAAIVAGGLLLAAAAKSAQLPFSPWLFRAMLGPTAASALLHSATMVAAGAYALARLAPIIPVPWLAPSIAALGLATALAGGVVAVLQTDLKKALAASTSAQYGLMFVAIGVGVPAAAGMHLATHAAFKALLFLGAGIALHATGTLELSSLRLGRALPLTAITFAIGALALAGVPPLGGAYSKEQIVAAASQTGLFFTAGVTAAASLSALYAGRLALLAFGPDPNRGEVRPPNGAVTASVLLLAGVTLVSSVLWFPGVAASVAELMGGELAIGEGWAAGASLVAIAAAGIACWLLWRRGDLVDFGLSPKVRLPVAEWLGIPLVADMLVKRPVLTLARTLATMDDRIIDAGVRGAARIAGYVSRLFGHSLEQLVDAGVNSLSTATRLVAEASRMADDRGVDATIEGAARGVGAVGTQSRRLQTGLSHQYYLIVAIGTVLLIAIASLEIVATHR